MPIHRSAAPHARHSSLSQPVPAQPHGMDARRRIARMLDRHAVPFSIKRQCLRILDQLDERKAVLLEARLKDFFQ